MMEQFFQNSEDTRRTLLLQTQSRVGLPPVSVEKDFWVCLVLRELFRLTDWGPHLTFKGGTSLSKAWRLIKRFSEDIDIVVDRDFLGYAGDDLSQKQIKKLVKRCGERIQRELMPALNAQFGRVLPSGLKWSLVLAPVEEDEDQQTLLFDYPSCLGNAGLYVRPTVRIELGARSDIEPNASASIQPYMAEAFPDAFAAHTFSVRTVAARRTFWEKAMLLHEELHRPADKKRRARLSRHYYDLWCLIESGEAARAAADPDLFGNVLAHRRTFFHLGWMDYSTLIPGTLRIVPPKEQLDYWREDYAATGESLIFGKVPSFDEIMKVVGEFEREFNRLASSAG